MAFVVAVGVKRIVVGFRKRPQTVKRTRKRRRKQADKMSRIIESLRGQASAQVSLNLRNQLASSKKQDNHFKAETRPNRCLQLVTLLTVAIVALLSASCAQLASSSKAAAQPCGVLKAQSSPSIHEKRMEASANLSPASLAVGRHKRNAVALEESTGADLSRVVAVSGQTIEFQCPLANELLALATEQPQQQQQQQQQDGYTNSSTTGDLFTIIWRKDGALLSQLNPRLRLVQHQVARTASGAGAPGQQLEAPRSSLTIQQARAKLDEATYECQLIKARSLSLADSQALANEMEQANAELPQRPRPLKVHKFQLKLLVAPRLAPFEFPQDAQVGQRILVTCSALEGQRPISFVWLKDNQIIHSSEGSTSLVSALSGRGAEQATAAPHTLGQIHRRQLADKFALSAQASEQVAAAAVGGESPTRSPAYVLIERAADFLSGDDDNNGEHNADTTQLAKGQKPAATAAATAAQLSDSSIHVRQADDYSILTIDSLELKHAGRYTCSAQNEAARVAHGAQLAINAPPTLTIEPKDGDLVSGQSSVIECAAVGQPRPSLSWSRARESSGKQWDFVPIYENLRYSILPNGSLSITNVTQREQGFYMCTARNGFGPEVTKLIKITVHEPARIGTKYKSVEARVDERAQLTCSASGEFPLSVVWFDKDSKKIDKQDRRFVMDESTGDGEQVASEATAKDSSQIGPKRAHNKPEQTVVSKLIIAKSVRLDSGHYTCEAKNRHGQDKMIVSLLVQDVPDKVNELKVTNVTASTISLRWQLGFAGNAPVSSYLVQYQSDDPLDDLLASAASGQHAGPAGFPASVQQQQQQAGLSLSDPLATLLELEQRQQLGSGQSNADATASGQAQAAPSLKAALEALNSALGARLSPDKTNLTNGNQQQQQQQSSLGEQNSVAFDVLDEAIDRTLVELTVEQSASNLVIKDLSPYCVYRLRLAAINKIGLGEFSEWIRAKTEESPPSGSAMKMTASATGPNSIKLAWLPPDRRSWNGQLTGFNIGYRPLDSAFELNKTLEWTPPSLALTLLESGVSASENSTARAGKQQQQLQAKSKAGSKQVAGNSTTTTTTGGGQAARSAYALKQHLRQLLALQQQELVAHLTNLQRSTTYLVWIQAINSRGIGPQSHAISVKTLDDVPPSAPALRIQSTRQNSITISWTMLSNFVSSANQYSLFYRLVPPLIPPGGTHISQAVATVPRSPTDSARDNQAAALFSEPGPFIERTISSQQLMQFASAASMAQQQQQQQQQPSGEQVVQNLHQQHYQQFVYTLDQLDCGSIYELYMTTRNSVGKSEPSPMVTTRTQGEPPLAPVNKNNLFARIGSQDVLLNLATWSTGGCPLTHIGIRYKKIPAPSAAASTANESHSSSPVAPGPSSGWPISTSVPPNLLLTINHQEAAMASSRQMASQIHLGGSASSAGPQIEAQSLHGTPVAPFALKNLQPSTGYELELIAHNSAGLTSAQYEFVTAGLNGSRSGYTRREGVYRLDARGQQLEQVSQSMGNDNHGGQPQMLPPTMLDHTLAHRGGHLQQATLVSAGQQLVPLLLTLLCFACLIVSSTFCYYRLAAVWDKRCRRRASSNNDDDETTTTRGIPASPSSTVKSSVGDWRLAMHQRHARQTLDGATVRRAHAGPSQFATHHHGCAPEHHEPIKPMEGDDDNHRLRLQHCDRLKSSSFMSQSVSMRDLQLGANGSATLNLKPVGTCRLASNRLSAATIARTGPNRMFESRPVNSANYGERTCQPPESVYTNHQVNGGEGAYSGAMCQQETSWNSAQPQQVMPPPQQLSGHQTYAIPSAEGQFHHQEAYVRQDSHEQSLIYQQQQQSNNTYGGIDACIQHLLMSQQQQSNGGQQYATLMGQKAVCNYAEQHVSCTGQEQENAKQFSSSGSSSGFGGDQSLSTQLQLQQIDCSGAHQDCGSSIITSGLTGASSNRSECLFGDISTLNKSHCQQQQQCEQHDERHSVAQS